MIYIYLESETPTEKKFTNEADFIKTFIEVVFSKKYNKDFVIIGFNGYKNLEKQYNKLKEHEEDDYKNLVIFDSDFPVTGDGFSTRKQYLEDLKEKFKIEFELFLYPNNKDDGIFENLHEQIVNQKHQEVIEYFKEYESKLKNSVDEDGNCPYETPDQKARMYAYISAFKRSLQEKELFKNRHQWSFKNKDYWDLRANALIPLKQFLSQFFE